MCTLFFLPLFIRLSLSRAYNPVGMHTLFDQSLRDSKIHFHIMRDQTNLFSFARAVCRSRAAGLRPNPVHDIYEGVNSFAHVRIASVPNTHLHTHPHTQPSPHAILLLLGGGGSW